MSGAFVQPDDGPVRVIAYAAGEGKVNTEAAETHRGATEKSS